MLILLAVAAASRQAGAVRVFAAASLKEAFTQIARGYEASHRGAKVQLNFGGSQTLATQISHGAPADVFASAAQKNLDQVPYDRGTRRIFARNQLAIAIRPGYHGVSSVQTLTNARNLVIGDPAVPVGRYTESFFKKAAKRYGAGWDRQVRAHIVSREADVKAVLAKVRIGEADAGIVYSSDIVSAGGKVGRVEIPESLNEIAEYPVAVLSYAENPSDAKSFVAYLGSGAAQRILRAKGFAPPPQKESKRSNATAQATAK